MNFQRAVLDNVRRNLAEVPLASRTRDDISGQSIQDTLIRELRGTLMRDVQEPHRAMANIESYLKDCKAVSEDPTLLMAQIFRESLPWSSTSETSGPILAGLEHVCSEARDILLKAKDAGQASTAADFVVSQAWVESKVAWGEATQEAAKNRLRDFEALTNPLNDSERTSLPDLAYRVVASHLGEVFSLGRSLLDSARTEYGSQVTWEWLAEQPAWQDYVETEVERLLTRTQLLKEYDTFLSSHAAAGLSGVVTMETMFEANPEIRADRVYIRSFAFREVLRPGESPDEMWEQGSRDITRAWLEGQRRYDETHPAGAAPHQHSSGPHA